MPVLNQLVKFLISTLYVSVFGKDFSSANFHVTDSDKDYDFL